MINYMSNKELKIIRIGGEPVGSITITKENSYEFNHRYSQFNIKKIELFFKNVKEFKGRIRVEIFEEEYKSLVGEQIIENIEEGWNEFVLPYTVGVFEENLKIKVKIEKGNSIEIATDKYDAVCMRLLYEDVQERELALERS